MLSPQEMAVGIPQSARIQVANQRLTLRNGRRPKQMEEYAMFID